MSGREGAPARESIIPIERLPPGFAERLDSPPASSVPALPAATVVLLRDGEAGPEVLLLRRVRTSGFVPGAWVFPGGRVDPADAAAELVERADGLPGPPAGDPDGTGAPDVASWMAAVRELFEETGVLLARTAAGRQVPSAAADAHVEELRESLMQDRATLLDVVRALDARLDLRRVVYCAHWITPLAERRRYDTRFFLAALPAGCDVAPDPREMTDAAWLTPAAALARFADGGLPMVFPTVRTLESIAGIGTIEETLAAFRGRRIPAILPRLVRTPGGVAIVVDE